MREKSADEFHARVIQLAGRNNGWRNVTACIHTHTHTANENFAGAIVNFITVAVATFYARARVSFLIITIFFVSVSYLPEKREYVGGKEDDENYVVTPGSSCQRSSTQRPRYIHGGCRNVSFAPRVPSTLTWQNGERKRAQKASTQRLKPYERVQVNARIISMTCLCTG